VLVILEIHVPFFNHFKLATKGIMSPSCPSAMHVIHADVARRLFANWFRIYPARVNLRQYVFRLGMNHGGDQATIQRRMAVPLVEALLLDVLPYTEHILLV
jgi:hypothetical protein